MTELVTILGKIIKWHFLCVTQNNTSPSRCQLQVSPQRLVQVASPADLGESRGTALRRQGRAWHKGNVLGPHMAH